MERMAEPARRTATYEDLLKVPDGLVAEIIAGELHTSPRPAARHASAATNVAADLVGPFGRGRGGPGGWQILFEPELHLGPDVLVPDLAGWRRERLPIPPEDDGVIDLRPDWLCEIISPTHAARDLVRKKRIYLQHQVPHYWIIDPRDSMLTVLRWSAPGYVEVLLAQVGEVVHAEPFDQVELVVSDLFSDFSDE